MFPSLIFAHRGANREAAENTKAAFDAALLYPIDGIETDIQLTRDGQLVLWHDRLLNKLGMPTARIDDFDWSQLSQFNFAAHFSTNVHEPPMLLQDFVRCYLNRVPLLLEVKNREWETLERQRLKIDKTLQLMGSYCVQQFYLSSFHLESLLYGRQRQPSCRYIYNLEPDASMAHIQSCLQQHHFLAGYCLPIELLEWPLVEQLKTVGKLIAVYTCNSDQQIQHALQLQVDIVISDLPSQAVKLRDQYAAKSGAIKLTDL